MESTYFVGVKEKLFFYNFRNNIYVDRKYGQLKSQTGRNLSVYSLNPKNFSYQFCFYQSLSTVDDGPTNQNHLITEKLLIIHQTA